MRLMVINLFESKSRQHVIRRIGRCVSGASTATDTVTALDALTIHQLLIESQYRAWFLIGRIARREDAERKTVMRLMKKFVVLMRLVRFGVIHCV